MSSCVFPLKHLLELINICVIVSVSLPDCSSTRTGNKSILTTTDFSEVSNTELCSISIWNKLLSIMVVHNLGCEAFFKMHAYTASQKEITIHSGCGIYETGTFFYKLHTWFWCMVKVEIHCSTKSDTLRTKRDFWNHLSFHTWGNLVISTLFSFITDCITKLFFHINVHF